MKVELDNGKYTVRTKPDGGLEALRYGEEWRDLTGDSLVFAMAHEIAELRGAIHKAKSCLVCAPISDNLSEVIDNTSSILAEARR